MIPYSAPTGVPSRRAFTYDGGQIRLPFTPHWSWLNYRKGEKAHADGLIADPQFGQPGNHLYVNRGIGSSEFPIRINCMPEITLFTLKGGE